MDFTTGKELISICDSCNITIAEAMIRREELCFEGKRSEMRAEMEANLAVMVESIESGLGTVRSQSGLSGGDAMRLWGYADGDSICSTEFLQSIAAAMSVVECNASMGRIVAAPTAGSSGILPGVLISLGKVKKLPRTVLVNGLFTASAIGMIIATHATIAGADGGCQAEVGAAAAMSAAALVEVMGGSPRAALDAAAMALKNMMGLVCDPVGGLVECPCVKRNAIGAANAMMCADMALSGITSVIPFDEVVDAMAMVGQSLPAELKETALGGVAATPTARQWFTSPETIE